MQIPDKIVFYGMSGEDYEYYYLCPVCGIREVMAGNNNLEMRIIGDGHREHESIRCKNCDTHLASAGNSRY